VGGKILQKDKRGGFAQVGQDEGIKKNKNKARKYPWGRRIKKRYPQYIQYD